MSETVDRIDAKATTYHLGDCEHEMIGRYYRVHLLDDRTARDTDTLITFAAAARNIASMWADLPEDVASRIPTDNHSPINRAARIMYFAAELVNRRELKSHWAREAAIAYLQGGNFPAARTALRLSRRFGADQRPGDQFLDALLSFHARSPGAHAALPRGLRYPWRCADMVTVHSTQQQIYALCTASQEGFDKSIGYRISQLLPLVGSLSLLRIVNDATVTLPPWYRRALKRSRRMIVLPSQQPALTRWLPPSFRCCS